MGKVGLKRCWFPPCLSVCISVRCLSPAAQVCVVGEMWKHISLNRITDVSLFTGVKVCRYLWKPITFLKYKIPETLNLERHVTYIRYLWSQDNELLAKHSHVYCITINESINQFFNYRNVKTHFHMRKTQSSKIYVKSVNTYHNITF